MLEFPIQMYDPKREYTSNKTNIDQAIQNVLNHGIFINGPEIKELDQISFIHWGKILHICVKWYRCT